MGAGSPQLDSIDESEVGAEEMQRELKGSKDNEGRMNKGNTNEFFNEVQIENRKALMFLHICARLRMTFRLVYILSTFSIFWEDLFGS